MEFFYAGITLTLGELFLAPKTYHLVITFLMCEIPNCLAFLLLRNLLTSDGYIMEIQQTVCIFAGVFYVATVILIHLLCIYHSIFAVSSGVFFLLFHSSAKFLDSKRTHTSISVKSKLIYWIIIYNCFISLKLMVWF